MSDEWRKLSEEWWVIKKKKKKSKQDFSYFRSTKNNTFFSHIYGGVYLLNSWWGPSWMWKNKASFLRSTRVSKNFSIPRWILSLNYHKKKKKVINTITSYIYIYPTEIYWVPYPTTVKFIGLPIFAWLCLFIIFNLFFSFKVWLSYRW